MTIGKEKFVANNREEVEHEPSELDVVTDDLGDEGDDELDEGVAAPELEDDEDAEEPASPLAEDAPPARARKSKEAELESAGFEVKSRVEEESADDLDDSPGVRTSGGEDVAPMSQAERRRQFPSVPRGEGQARKKGGPRKGQPRGRKSAKPAAKR